MGLPDCGNIKWKSQRDGETVSSAKLVIMVSFGDAVAFIVFRQNDIAIAISHSQYPKREPLGPKIWLQHL